MSVNYVVLEYEEFETMMGKAHDNIIDAENKYINLQSKLKSEIVGKTFFTRRPVSKWKKYLNETSAYFNGMPEVLYKKGEIPRAVYLCLVYKWSIEYLGRMLSDHSVRDIHLNESDFNILNIVSTRIIV